MQVIGIGVYSRRMIFFFAALMTYSGFISDQGSGLALAPVAMAQDNLELDAEGDSDSAVADASEPVLVVSIASLNKLMLDVNYITSVVGQPQAGGMFTMMAGGFTQGLDTSRPIGILVPIVDGAPEPIGLLPTPDVEAMLKRLEAQTGPVDKLEDGTLVLAAGPSLVYIRQVDTWAVIARQKELLDLAPADPSSLFEDLGDNYTLSALLNVQLIPAETREGLIAQMRQGFEQAMAQQGEDSENIQAASEDSIKQLEQIIRESETLMLGWNINPEEKVVTFEAEFTAAEGTEMAEMYAGQAAIPSKFAAVIDDENAMYYHAAASIGPKLVERTEESIKSAGTMLTKAIEDSDDLQDEDKEKVTALMTQVMDLVGKSVAEGKFDIGVQAVADDGELDITAGMFVSDGEAAAKIVKDLAEELKSEPNAPTFEFDQETYKNVTLHSMMIDIPADKEKLRETLGEQAIVKIGTSEKAVYISAGTDSEQSIKDFIDASDDEDDPTDRPIGQMQIRLLPFLRFAQSVEANDVVASMIDTLSQDDETDYMLVQAEMIENGQSSYVEIGEGILKAIGAAVRETQMQKMKEAQAQGGGQF